MRSLSTATPIMVNVECSVLEHRRPKLSVAGVFDTWRDLRVSGERDDSSLNSTFAA
jgi:hypothetical protein